MAYCVPLRFVRLGPDVAICATRIVAIMSTNAFQARQSIKAEKRNGTLINACGRSKALSAVFLDNGSVVSSPFGVMRLMHALDRANAKELNPKQFRPSTKYRVYEAIGKEPDDMGAYQIEEIAADLDEEASHVEDDIAAMEQMMADEEGKMEDELEFEDEEAEEEEDDGTADLPW